MQQKQGFGAYKKKSDRQLKEGGSMKIGIIGAPLTYSFSIPSDIDLPTGIERLFPIVTVPENLIVPDGENFKVE